MTEDDETYHRKIGEPKTRDGKTCDQRIVDKHREIEP